MTHTIEFPAPPERPRHGWRDISVATWLSLALVLILAVTIVALMLDRPPRPGEGPVNYILFAKASEKGPVGLDVRGIADALVLRSIPTTTEILVIVSLKVDGSGAAYQLEIENPAGGKATQPLRVEGVGKSSISQIQFTGFEVDEPGVFEFRVLRDGKLVAARELPVSQRGEAAR